MVLRSPYPWFGGKSKVASLIWDRFGDVANYVEPFFGSGAVLLSRRHWPWDGHRIETVNDLDGMVSNFWRAVAADPEAVAHYADWPVSECDLHARHLWLVNDGRAHVERLKEEPDYYDVKIAGWWVWGCCQWIGSGWCMGKSSWGKPFADGKLAHPRIPHLGDAGRGVHRPSQKLPHLGDAGRELDIYPYFRLLAERFRGVRVCCGDWSRVCGPTPTTRQGLTAIFFDPPYAASERDEDIYAIESEVGPAVRAWCLDKGDNPGLRIALCGYAGEGHEELERRGWECVPWKANGGYASQGECSNENARRERIWFSPHCLPPVVADLFSAKLLPEESAS